MTKQELRQQLADLFINREFLITEIGTNIFNSGGISWRMTVYDQIVSDTWEVSLIASLNGNICLTDLLVIDKKTNAVTFPLNGHLAAWFDNCDLAPVIEWVKGLFTIE